MTKWKHETRSHRLAKKYPHPDMIERGKRSPLIERLLKAISPFDLGINKVRIDKTEYLIKRINQGFTEYWNAALLLNHAYGIWDLYHCANYMADEWICSVDIDCHEFGTLEDSMAFAEYLNKKLFRGKGFITPSVKGKGVHIHFWLNRLGWTAQEGLDALNRLETWLDQARIRLNAKISGVEVRGTPSIPVFQVPDKKFFVCAEQMALAKYLVADINHGRLERVPRFLGREDELMKTCILTVDALNSLHIKPEPAGMRKVLGNKKSTGFWRSMEQEDLDAMPGARLIAEKLFLLAGTDRLQLNRRHVSIEDAEIFLKIMAHCYANPMVEQAMPQSRARDLQNDMYLRGLVSRPFDDKRWTAFRDFLSTNGHIEWMNAEYQPPQGEEGGKACIWKLSKAVIETMGGETGIVPLGTGQPLFPRRLWIPDVIGDPLAGSFEHLIEKYQPEWAMSA